jgi:hypothetical protein
MSNAFRSLISSISGRLGLDPRADVIEYEFEWEGRTVRILPNPKDDELILVEAEFVDPEARPALETAAALTTLHRLNGEAVAVQDWRFAIDEAGTPILRANFRARDFEVPGGFEEIVGSAARFGDLVVAAAEIAAAGTDTSLRDASVATGFIRG